MTLLDVQRRMAHAILQPLTGSDRTAPKTDAGFIKPNDRFSSTGRLRNPNTEPVAAAVNFQAVPRTQQNRALDKTRNRVRNDSMRAGEQAHDSLCEQPYHV